MSDIVVDVKNVSMKFKLYKEKIDNIKEYFIRTIQGRLQYEEFWALKNISFTIESGVSIGLIGRNGAGKSTMLKLLAGVMKPSEGIIKVYGSVAPLIELGAGFDPDLTAMENIYLNGAVLGYSKALISKKIDEIIDFAELWEFVDMPVKNFSSGMYARLGFSIATICQPDIFIVDEVLSVGDFKFQEKCEEKITNMIKMGTTLFFVSHSIEQVTKICHKALWIENGKMKMFGKSEDVCNAYIQS